MRGFNPRVLIERIGYSLRCGGGRFARQLPKVTLVGNPFDAIGRSEHLRTIWRALRTSAIEASIYDVYGHAPEPAVAAEMGHCQVDTISNGIRIFHLNGDEIESALHKIAQRQSGFFSRGY